MKHTPPPPAAARPDPSHGWPLPHDPVAAARLTERFAALGDAEARLAARPDIAAMLDALGGNSPFLSDLAVREATTVARFAAEGADAPAADAMAALRRTPVTARRETVAAALREAKRRIALLCALADIGGRWSLERVTETLSDLADATLDMALGHLLRTAHDMGDLLLPDPAHPAACGGFAVLGMGKLGARELNYSSDVDLILLFDPTAPIYTERTTDHAMVGFTARIARALVALMETRDAGGYVFRTDLRLRPDPSATPPALALTNAITYYESMGQNWERAAMIKARPVAGDLSLGFAFLEAIRPFVWRRGLDFAAVADIQAMKRRIDRHKGGALNAAADPVARIAGHNVKLGEGGIREIEFLVQTLQLVWGGRDPGLRDRATLAALRLLTGTGHIPPDAAEELAEAYRFLRRVEHRLQMVHDRQTHSPAGQTRGPRPHRRLPWLCGRHGLRAGRCCANWTACAPITRRCSTSCPPRPTRPRRSPTSTSAATGRRPPPRSQPCAPWALGRRSGSSTASAHGRRGMCARCARSGRGC